MPNEPMTKAQFLEKFSTVQVKFADYYKFTFRFFGMADNEQAIVIYIGGNADDIYCLKILADGWHHVQDFESILIGYRLRFEDYVAFEN